MQQGKLPLFTEISKEEKPKRKVKPLKTLSTILLERNG